MNYQEAGAYWEQNAEAWTALSRAGFDVYRDHLNTPAFLEALPHIAGSSGIDIGCGEGHNTRLLAQRGAAMTGIDISPRFISEAIAAEQSSPMGIQYITASAASLPFDDERFDFATSFMCLMDVPDPAPALAEAWRVLKPGGFLQFSITHPCFTTPHRKNLRTLAGKTYAIQVGDYFTNMNGQIEEWLFGAAPVQLKRNYRPFRIPLFNHTLSYWVNTIIRTGFVMEYMQEPRPPDETVQRVPALQDAQVVAYFLHIRCRKQ